MQWPYSHDKEENSKLHKTHTESHYSKCQELYGSNPGKLTVILTYEQNKQTVS